MAAASNETRDINRKKAVASRRINKKERNIGTIEAKDSANTESVPEKIKLPKKPEDISTNWAKLSQTLKRPKPRSKTDHPKPKKECLDIWFDGVEEEFLDVSSADVPQTSLVKDNVFQGLTRAVALDCEMVGVGERGHESVLARISIVNHFGHTVLDKYVLPEETVTDYRTKYSGIRPKLLEKKGEKFSSVVKEVSDIIKGRIVVGHALHNDFKVLYLSHPKKRIRDTSRYGYFRKLFNGGIPSLKKLSEKLLGVKIQEGEHDSVQDARAAMRLYTMFKRQWENDIKAKRRKQQSSEKTNDDSSE